MARQVIGLIRKGIDVQMFPEGKLAFALEFIQGFFGTPVNG